ncbi:hypothetical protein MTX78_06025 [Hymenobacter tibetensis]|uniref:Outer membrane protein beta-barrel domain-containing protein n=1 Tax=Hymenobacter tibetensis TaxID=497967 RepID=A0ABY4D2A2_9BACT|nr:hypothetical protein [Hymenobacter tibetensis]UOG76152.1 hypothetical protein MTX78_06025 [Hymenobacter tibetensis]
MKISTVLAALLVVAAGVPAIAQTELNTRPVAPSTPAPAPGVRSNPPALQTAGPADLRRHSNSSLGVELGWGGPYGGLGVSYAHLIGPATDINAGVGIGVGGKIGLGVRHFLNLTKAVSPYVGLNVSRSGRIDEVSLTLDEGMPTEESTIYNLAPSGILHLRSGLRWQPGRVGLLGTLGYGIRFTGDPISYVNGLRPSQRMSDLINIISPGGVEVSLGMSISLGH